MNERFDVFISCRQTDDDGRPSRDSVLGAKLHEFLSARGLRSFMAEKSLRDLGDADYQRAINRILEDVPVLVAVGTCRGNLQSNWVAYEVGSFFNDVLSGRKRGCLLSYVEGMDLKDLPLPLRINQAIQHSEGAPEILFSHVAAALSVLRVESMTRDGQMAVDRFNKLTEVMAESRLLELEITSSGVIGMMLTEEQRAQMKEQITALRALLKGPSR